MFFGKNLQFLRKMSNGMTQEELAEEINITDRHLRNLRERDTDISVSLCYRLSQVFQIPMEELLVVREEEMEE